MVTRCAARDARADSRARSISEFSCSPAAWIALSTARASGFRIGQPPGLASPMGLARGDPA